MHHENVRGPRSVTAINQHATRHSSGDNCPDTCNRIPITHPAPTDLAPSHFPQVAHHHPSSSTIVEMRNIFCKYTPTACGAKKQQNKSRNMSLCRACEWATEQQIAQQVLDKHSWGAVFGRFRCADRKQSSMFGRWWPEQTWDSMSNEGRTRMNSVQTWTWRNVTQIDSNSVDLGPSFVEVGWAMHGNCS